MCGLLDFFIHTAQAQKVCFSELRFRCSTSLIFFPTETYSTQRSLYFFFVIQLYQQNASAAPWRSGPGEYTTTPQQVSQLRIQATSSVDPTADTEFVAVTAAPSNSFIRPTSINTWPVEACWWFRCTLQVKVLQADSNQTLTSAALTTPAGSEHINLPEKHSQTFKFKQPQLKAWTPLCWKSRTRRRSVTGGQRSSMWSF